MNTHEVGEESRLLGQQPGEATPSSRSCALSRRFVVGGCLCLLVMSAVICAVVFSAKTDSKRSHDPLAQGSNQTTHNPQTNPPAPPQTDPPAQLMPVLFDALTDTAMKYTLSVPDSSFLPLKVSQETTSSQAFSSAQDYISQKSHQYGIGVSVPGLFAASVDVKFFEQTDSSSSTSVYVGECSSEILEDSAAITPSMVLGSVPDLTASLRGLVNSTNASDSTYFGIFNRFGTYFVSQVQRGGKLSMHYRYQQTDSSTSSLSKSEVAAAAQAVFFSKVSVSASTQVDQAQVQTFFKYSSANSQTIVTVGGDPLLASNYTLWKASIPLNLGVVEFQLSPLHELLEFLLEGEPDQVIERQVAAMQTAALRYFKACGTDTYGQACNGHGYCDIQRLSCICDVNFFGELCEFRSCPASGGIQCAYNESFCDHNTGVCNCPIGFNVESDGTCKKKGGYQVTYQLYASRNGEADAYPEAPVYKDVYDEDLVGGCKVIDLYNTYNSYDSNWKGLVTVQFCPSGEVYLQGQDEKNGQTCSSEGLPRCGDISCTWFSFEASCQTTYGCFLECGHYDYSLSGKWTRILT